MGLLSFLFGKKPKITFTDDGRAIHNHPQKKWDDWKNRFQQDPHYNWRNHSGTKGTPQFTPPKK